MVWNAPKTWATNEVLTAFDLNTYLRDNMRLTLPNIAAVESGYFVSDGENLTAQREWAYAEVNIREGTSSTTYTDLATPGPAVTVDCGSGGALVFFATHVSTASGSGSLVSVEITGASAGESEATADDERSLAAIGHDHYQAMQTVFYDTLNQGENTFTLKYKVNSGTTTFRRRRIGVLPL